MTTQTPDAVREARKIAADVLGLPPGLRSEYMDGKFDTGDHVRIVLAALDSRAGDAGEGKARTTISGHTVDCAWHVDQYPHECTCALATPVPAVDAVPAGEVER